MEKEIEEALVRDFPEIFRDWHGNPMQTCMAWGLDCGTGWASLIRKLCEDITALGDTQGFRAAQVKEKFGGLRFYYDGGDEKIDGMVWLAEHMSYHTCEECGSITNIGQTKGWIITLCEDCSKKVNKVWEKYKE